MKKAFPLFALLSMSATILHAAPLYTIHLSNAERFHNCTVIYRSSTTTKFRGLNRNGKEVIKEIPSSSILYMAEIPKPEQKEKPAKEPATEKPKELTPTTTPKKDDAPAPKAETEKPKESTGEPQQQPAAEGKQSTAPGENTEQSPAPQSEFHDANVPHQDGANMAEDVTLKLREKLQQMETALQEIKTPSRSLRSICDSTKSRIDLQLKNLDKLSLEIADLQGKFNSFGVTDYQFQIQPNERERFLHDATAAYDAMVVDMKERKSRRKVGGLDKFEILYLRYQGAPEYKKAHEWYIKTLKDLHKKWHRMLTNETAKRKRLPEGRAKAMIDSDSEEFSRMEAYFQREGEEVSKVWYTPSPRNVKMLNNCINKANEKLRQNEYSDLDREVGTVPALLKQFWAMMDEARRLMVSGNLEAAETLLKNDTHMQAISRLKSTTMPHEYRNPLTTEKRDLLSEIRKRIRERRALKSNLERKTDQLNRAVAAAESQIANAMDAITRESEMQTEEEIIEIVGEEKAPEKKQPEAKSNAAAQAQPAAPAPAAAPNGK